MGTDFQFCRTSIQKGDKRIWFRHWLAKSDIDSTKIPEENLPHDLRISADRVRVGLLHGKIPAEEKAVMADFKANKLQVLFCQPFARLGVDVPGHPDDSHLLDADHSELATHQLRDVSDASMPKKLYLVAVKGKQEKAHAYVQSRQMDFISSQKDLELHIWGKTVHYSRL